MREIKGRFEKGRNSHEKKVKWHSDAKKIEAVTTWLVLGKSNLVAAAVDVPEGTIRQWRTQPWWNELVAQIQIESDQELDAKLAHRIDKALALINDRLENGDFLYDPKTSAFIRKPLGARDVWRIGNEMIDKRWLIRKLPKEQNSQEAVGDILKNLANEFAQMAKKRVKETLDVSTRPEPVETTNVEELQERVSELPGETPANS